ncbi:hypothetical protein CsSME_00018596 [Camellia sinensis var. sinensis]
MANDRQKEKVGDDISTRSDKQLDPNTEEDNCNEETRDQNPGEKDFGKEGVDAPRGPHATVWTQMSRFLI